jgi:endonuclease YncB( thermonuclease family)
MHPIGLPPRSAPGGSGRRSWRGYRRLLHRYGAAALLILGAVSLGCLGPIHAYAQSGAPGDADDPDTVLWQAVNPQHASELHAYLRAYPRGAHAAEAQAKLEALERPQPPPQIVIEGVPKVINTATLQINGRNVPLFGVLPTKGADSEQVLQLFLREQGNSVTCRSLENDTKRFSCLTTTGVDVAKAALLNGAARVADDAPSDYHAQEDAARAAHRGVWK